MGASLSWFAIRNKTPAEVLREFGLQPTGRKGSYPEVQDSAALLPTGWYVVCRWRHEYHDSMLQQLSRGAEVIACFIEEHVMYSQSSAWKDGRELWSLVHVGEKGTQHLETRGELPPEYFSIRDRLLADQAAETEGVDHIIDIPIQTAESFTDFEYEADPAEYGFEALERVSLFKKIFGK